MAKLEINNVIKRFGKIEVIKGVDLTVADGEFCVFVGPSGCGKSTLLRMIAGLEAISDGNMTIGDRDITHTDASKRGVSMVFQTYALYPHMTVRENMSFGLKISGAEKSVIKEKIDTAARILKLDALMDRKPKALSGGQRQRVAIGRAIVRQPDVFLFDEPLSNLDAELRVEMRVEIARLHKKLGATMIYVTHDQVEAMTMADKIVVLKDGIIEQIGSPLNLYEDPDNLFVAGFIGSPRMNLFNGIVTDVVDGKTIVRLPSLNNIEVPISVVASTSPGDAVTVGIRPEHFDPEGDIQIELVIDVVENLGGVSYIYAESHEDELPVIVEWRSKENPKGSGSISVGIDATSLLLFDSHSGNRIR